MPTMALCQNPKGQHHEDQRISESIGANENDQEAEFQYLRIHYGNQPNMAVNRLQ